LGTNLPPTLPIGSVVEARGVTASGSYAPFVDRAAIQVVGEAPMPEALRLPVARMMAGEGCWQYVRIEGVVRDMNRNPLTLALSTAAEGRRFTAYLYGYNQVRSSGLPLEWLEARVVIEGVCGTLVNDRDKPIGFNLSLSDTSQVHLLTPGNTNLFD